MIQEINHLIRNAPKSDIKIPLILIDDGHGWETKGKRSQDFNKDGRPDIKENHSSIPK